jgi:hypothetical protein
MDALDDVDTVDHRPGGSVPFSDYEHITLAQCIDGLLQLRATLALPDAFSRWISWHLSARRVPIWRSRFWLLVDTRA